MPENYRLIISKMAEEDIKDIIVFCSNISYSYAYKTEKVIKESISTLQVFPKGYPKLEIKENYYEYRVLNLKKYKIYFKIFENNIFIVRIQSCKQNPKKFKFINYVIFQINYSSFYQSMIQ